MGALLTGGLHGKEVLYENRTEIQKNVLPPDVGQIFPAMLGSLFLVMYTKSMNFKK